MHQMGTSCPVHIGTNVSIILPDARARAIGAKGSQTKKSAGSEKDKANGRSKMTKEFIAILEDMVKEYELLAKYNGGKDYLRWNVLQA